MEQAVQEQVYLLGGSWYFRFFALPTGSYDAASAGELPLTKEGCSSSSSIAAAEVRVDRSRRGRAHCEHVDDLFKADHRRDARKGSRRASIAFDCYKSPL